MDIKKRLELHSLWLAGDPKGSRADLRGANLQGASLQEATLRGACLRGADLWGACLPYYQIPQEGSLVVYKKLKGGSICKLLIPATARRTASLVGRKCRAEFAEVLEGEGRSKHHAGTTYRTGLTVKPDRYDSDPRVECTHGIHFFLTEEEAKNY